ncbi:hypothetical protein FWD07_02190 [Candidatus Saccharibacteria bacterium]|nr:hypothetical protein [Candidatus Saccharibacteria bacterium]
MKKRQTRRSQPKRSLYVVFVHEDTEKGTTEKLLDEMAGLTKEFDYILEKALSSHVKKRTMRTSAWRLNHHDEIGLYGNQFWIGVNQRVMKVITKDIQRQFKELQRRLNDENLRRVRVNFGWGVRGSWKR